MLTHKTDEELIDTATKLAGYSEAGAVLRELVKRWQVQCELSEQQHLQMITLAAESEVIRQRQQGQPLVLPTLDNVVNQLKAVALVELSADLHTAIQTSPRIASIIPMDVLAFTHCADSTIARAIAKLLYLPIGPRMATGLTRQQRYNLTGMKEPPQRRSRNGTARRGLRSKSLTLRIRIMICRIKSSRAPQHFGNGIHFHLTVVAGSSSASSTLKMVLTPNSPAD